MCGAAPALATARRSRKPRRRDRGRGSRTRSPPPATARSGGAARGARRGTPRAGERTQGCRAAAPCAASGTPVTWARTGSRTQPRAMSRTRRAPASMSAFLPRTEASSIRRSAAGRRAARRGPAFHGETTVTPASPCRRLVRRLPCERTPRDGPVSRTGIVADAPNSESTSVAAFAEDEPSTPRSVGCSRASTPRPTSASTATMRTHAPRAARGRETAYCASLRTSQPLTICEDGPNTSMAAHRQAMAELETASGRAGPLEQRLNRWPEEFLKLYIAFKAKTNFDFVDVVPQMSGLRLSLVIRSPIRSAFARTLLGPTDGAPVTSRSASLPRTISPTSSASFVSRSNVNGRHGDG